MSSKRAETVKTVFWTSFYGLYELGCVAQLVTSWYIVTYLHFYGFETGVDHPDLEINKKWAKQL